MIGPTQHHYKEDKVGITMIRAKVKEEHVADVEQAAKRLFDAIEREQLQGVRYASTKLADGVTFVIFLQLQNPDDNPMAPLPEFTDFQEGLKSYLAGPPSPEQLTVVGSYRLFDR